MNSLLKRRPISLQYLQKSCATFDSLLTKKDLLNMQKLLLTAYTKSYMTNRLVPKWMTLIFVRGRHIRRRISRKLLEIEAWF